MRQTLATLACALAALAAALPAGAELVVGVSDDLPKGDGGAAFYDLMLGAGLRENRISVLWDPAAPTVIPDEAGLRAAVANAQARGIKVVLALYPGRARAVADSPAALSQFVGWVQQVARTFPEVRDVIVGNEPNQPRFWQPQFVGRRAVGCGSYQTLLAASYDALKVTDARITVIGVGLSPRGNDAATARSNASSSPVRCLRDIGAAYRASKRKLPIMDELSFHPFPDSSEDALMKGYLWPKAGVPNLDRIKQAVWDAFNGTAQPTFAEGAFGQRQGRAQAGPPLLFRLNEVGWQVGIPSAFRNAYHGLESVATTDESTQAIIYAQAVQLLACDPSVKSLLFFHLIDDPDLDRWQSGLIRADSTKRLSYEAVRQAIERTGGRCLRPMVAWRHATRVIAPSVRFSSRKKRPAYETNWNLIATALEATAYKAGIFRIAKPRLTVAARRSILRTLASPKRPRSRWIVTGKTDAYRERVVRFPKRRLAAGHYVFAVRLAAETNGTRTHVAYGRPFTVGKPKPPRRSGR